jgi:hypothetical protein
MKELSIEWKHYENEGATCLRCSATGKTLAQVVAQLEQELAPQGVTIRFTETKLSESEIPSSNMILLNGIPMEQLLAGAETSESLCSSCGCLAGRETFCRTIEFEGKSYEEIPEELIRKAVHRAIGLNRG